MNSNKRKSQQYETAFTLRISNEVLEQVDSSARADGRTRASYIRKLITDALNMEA